MININMDKFKKILPSISKKIKKKQYRKKTIPKAIREQCWLQNFGKKYEEKCYINWCKNIITVFDFQVGHDIPESKGGTLNLNNLKPICSRCNSSMGNNFTIKEWNRLNK
jgi:5-methylcytosine-specific restriction endonuclease McrA